jgi:ABC-type antimicrobial peptide transport system permease subunit
MMRLVWIAWRSITQRGVASLLTIFSMALGVMMVVAVLSIHGVVTKSFENNASLGYNMIVGPEGGEQQLVLNSVYYLSQPIDNIWYTYYLEFLPRAERDRLLAESLAVKSHEAVWQSAELAALSGGSGPGGVATALALDGIGLPLSPDARRQELDGPPVELGRDGKYGLMTDMAIPLCLGDYYGRFRVVGTTPQLFDNLVFDIDNNRKFEFAQGRNFKHHTSDHGYFEAVVGSLVAREIELPELHFQLAGDAADAAALVANHVNCSRIERDADKLVVTLGQGTSESDLFLTLRRLEKDAVEGRKQLTAAESAALKTLLAPGALARTRLRRLELGDQIAPAHGSAEGHIHARKFTIVGFLDTSGTPNDRAVFINMEGFYLMEDHAKPLEEDKEEPADDQPQETEAEQKAKYEQDLAKRAARKRKENELLRMADPEPLPVEQREVTAVLIKTPSPMIALGLESAVNNGRDAQAVLPVKVIVGLFEFFVDPIRLVLLVLTGMICIVSGISILVSIYNSMSERRHEIAVMRALGAGRWTVFGIILFESALLALGGGFVGWVAGHALCAAASPWIEATTGVRVGFFHFEPRIDVAALLGATTSAGGLMLPLELLLVPALLALAIVVGLWPALEAYWTDVSRSLGK